MKNRITAFLLALVLLLGCTGCALLETEYTYSEPYVDTLDRDPGDAIEVRNYNMLKAAILDMINSRQESAELRFSSYNGSVSDDLAAVSLEIKTANPLGAYAVDTLEYDTSRIVSYYIAEIQITYKVSAEQIRSIRSVNNETELDNYLHGEVLALSQPTAAVRVYLQQLDAEYIMRRIERICFDDPVGIPLPVRCEIRSFPNEGSNRIYELSLQYESTAQQREKMSQTLERTVNAIAAQLTAETPAQRALELAGILSGGLTGESGRYADSAYGALTEHSADSRGIALAYRALCAACDIPCTVVQGSIGAMGTEEHFWNLISLDGDYYHVDVSAFAADPAAVFLVSDDSLWGSYIWNTDDYPACSGALRYADVAPQPESEEPTEEVTDGEDQPEPGEESEPPEETSEINP